MKTIKFFMMAAVALMTAVSFSACSDDDSNPSNYERYQQEVDALVRTQRKHDKAILLVAFGATWQQAYDTFDTFKKEYQEEFGDKWDVYLAFSSAICINNARAGENLDNELQPTEVRNYYDPEHWLTALGRNSYKQIVVQSLQVIPGEEYRRVRDTYIKDFMNNRNGEFTEAYMKSLDLNVVIGTPLMAEEDDAKELAIVLSNERDIKEAAEDRIVAFMGHGNPVGYDFYGGNIRYLQLEEALRDINDNYYVGTVDMYGTGPKDVLKHIAGGTFDIKESEIATSPTLKTITYPANNTTKAQLYPLMSIAGDHAHNDMADPYDKKSWFYLFNAANIETQAYETNFTSACLKTYQEGTDYIPALGERAAVREMWMQHTRDAIAKLGTDEALSTPTTAPDIEEEEEEE